MIFLILKGKKIKIKKQKTNLQLSQTNYDNLFFPPKKSVYDRQLF